MKSKQRLSSYSFRNHIKILDWSPAYLGILLAFVFLLFSFLPSLLPRPWYIQGLISGFSLSIGYLFGIIISATTRWFLQKEFSSKIKEWAWKILIIILPLFLFGSLAFGRVWQNQVRRLVGIETLSPRHSFLLIFTIVFSFLLFFTIGKVFVLLARKSRKLFELHAPPRIAAGLAIALTIFLFYYAASGLLVKNFYKIADKSFSSREETIPEGITRPASTYKSGSPDSNVAWDDIGYQGRSFVGGGPSSQEINEYTGEEAREPIRIYAGYSAADNADGRAKLAVKELRRTKAFDREVLVIATPTGTGWIDPSASDALEYMHDGNTAIVTQQYSYLPSWISFLVDQDRATEAGRALYDAVIDEWSTYPENERPKLLVYGLSLGSFGGQDPFSGVNDIRRSVDGALFTGTPNDTRLWRDITSKRDEGSPQWQPIYDGGKSVRFASTKQEIVDNEKSWNDTTRILYLQHASDPIVWFDFNLLLNRPDWLNEKRGTDVSPATRWFPVLTFLHVGLDQAIAGSAPIGHGHYYIDTTAYAWQMVAQPEDWTTSDSEKLQKFLKQKNDGEIATP